MGKNKIINKEKRQYHNLQKVITIVIISVLVVICSVSYIRGSENRPLIRWDGLIFMVHLLMNTFIMALGMAL